VTKPFQALRRALLVEACERDRFAAGVNAVHQRLVRHQGRLAAQQRRRLDPGARSGRARHAHLYVWRMPVGAVIARFAEIEGFEVVAEFTRKATSGLDVFMVFLRLGPTLSPTLSDGEQPNRGFARRAHNGRRLCANTGRSRMARANG